MQPLDGTVSAGVNSEWVIGFCFARNAFRQGKIRY